MQTYVQGRKIYDGSIFTEHPTVNRRMTHDYQLGWHIIQLGPLVTSEVWRRSIKVHWGSCWKSNQEEHFQDRYNIPKQKQKQQACAYNSGTAALRSSATCIKNGRGTRSPSHCVERARNVFSRWFTWKYRSISGNELVSFCFSTRWAGK